MATKVLALDGHDGSGKTTLARLLADRTGAHHAQPFAGARGAALIHAYEREDYARVLAIGSDALSETLERAADGAALVLDRGWLTVSTLVPADLFSEAWHFWCPTALLWCDLPTTLGRLELRPGEPPQPRAWHRHFLGLYEERRQLRPGPTIRTDLCSLTDCLAGLEAIFSALAPFDPGCTRPRM